MIIIIFLIEKKLMGNKLPDSINKNDIEDSSNINGDWGLGIGDWGLGIGDWG